MTHVLLAEDRTVQWHEATNLAWSGFANYWSSSKVNLTDREYPYHLDLNIDGRIQNRVFPISMTNKILVTKSYVDLYERIKNGLRLDDISVNIQGVITRSLPLQDGVIITGQPGTGKSISLWYIAIRLLQDFPLEPLLMIQSDLVLLFYRNKAYTLTVKLDKPTQLPIEIFSLRGHRPSCVSLVEWKRGEPPQLDWPDLLPIFATSPSSTRTQDFVKRRDPFVWGMPTWTRYELRKGFEIHSAYPRVRQFLVEYRRPATLDEMVMDSREGPIYFVNYTLGGDVVALPKRAELEEDQRDPANMETLDVLLAMLVELSVKHFGWVPRDVYFYMASPSLAKLAPSTSKIQESLRIMRPSHDLVNIIAELNTAASPLSHQVFMQHAQLQSCNDLQNTRFIYHFRTEAAHTLFFNALKDSSWMALKEVLKSTTAQPATRVLGGNLFEPYAQQVLPSISDLVLFPMKKVSGSNSESKFTRYVSVTKSPQTIVVNFVRRNSIEFTNTAPNNIHWLYYYKGNSTTPLIDGFLIEREITDHWNIIIYFIQITTSEKKHSGAVVKGPAIVKDIQKRVEEAHAGATLDLRFVLVGPPCGIIGHEPNPTWELPSTLAEPYSVYHCDLPFPEARISG